MRAAAKMLEVTSDALLMGGQLTVESAPHRGRMVSFTVRLTTGMPPGE